MSKFKPHIALLVCNILWAMDYPFYNIVLPEYVHPMAMVSGSLIATALLSLIPLAWEKSEKVARTDIRRLIGAALLIGVLRKAFIMYGLSMTSPIDGSIIDTIVPLLVLVVSVLLGMDRFTKLKVAGLALGMAGAVAVVLTGISAAHTHSHLWGNILILLCACVTSLYMVWFKRLIAKYRITTVLRWLYCTAAIIALPDEKVEEICASVDGVVVAANYNCPGQLVISGAVEAVDAACEKAKAAGARRALRLPVGGAFHSPLMEPAKQELEKAIAEAPFQTPVCPVYQNVDAKPYTDPAAIKANLIAQLTAPVRWTYIVRNMLSDGVTEFTELGPGSVLQGLIRKVDPNAVVESKSTL